MDRLIENLRAVVGREDVLSEADELLVYECDGLPQHKHRPRAVVFPASTEEVSEVLRLLARERVPFSPRGAGTGLSGGALALGSGVIIELARMRRLLEIDPENRQAVVQTGMVNAHLTRAAAPLGLYYVPDPSSQMSCTIGGNLAENSGGIHCLKYGMTVDHVLAARVVLAGGEVVDLEMSAPGYDLLGVFVGSEGTFGIATEATLRLVPLPPAVRTLLAVFEDVNDASRAVSEIIAAGIVPAALEMMDGAIIRAVEASVFAAGMPLDVEAALLVELDGLEVGLDEESDRAAAICRRHGARDVRCAADEHERKRLWAARKGAFGAMGRISPDTMLQDAVVPRSRLPEVLAATYQIGARYGLRVANVFHAGDGNLHPFLCFDARHPEEVLRVKEAGRELMETCVRAGGSITGEHGVGLDKSDYLPLIFNEDDMETMLRVRAAFDPTGLCNPGKIIPTPRTCSEGRGTTRVIGNSGAESQASMPASLPGPANPSLRLQASAPAPSRAQRSFDAEKARAMLSAIVGDENVAGPSVSLEVAPASEAEACEVLRLSEAEGWAVVPAGAGTWADAGNTLSRADLSISTRRMARLLEHEPADLVTRAEAGLTLHALNEELAGRGQWLPLDPPDDGHATLGGVVATGQRGAQSLGYGAPRSYVIGMRAALADGRVVKSGGRVVKNVAGYDLCKLFGGSYGTLALILELTFKLRPLPATAATVAAQGPLPLLLKSARALQATQLLPVAVEMLSAGAATRADLSGEGSEPALMVRFAGTREAVAFQAGRTLELLRDENVTEARVITDGEDEACWRGLAALPLQAEHELIWRAGLPATELQAFLEKVLGDAPSPALWHAGLGDGRLRVFDNLSGERGACAAALERLRAEARAKGGSLVIERAPAEIKSSVDAWGLPGAASGLMGRVRKELDPQGRMSPGRFSF